LIMNFYRLMIFGFASMVIGCSSNKLPEIPLASEVDLARFMGDWYVIAAIPTFIEKNSFNAIENYKLNPDGTIATTFTFNSGSLEGKVKAYHPRGFVVEGTNNALWGMQFIWPVKGEYRISYIDSSYLYTIVARNKRDYVWIMARSSKISDEKYAELVKSVADMGYDSSLLRLVPHND